MDQQYRQRLYGLSTAHISDACLRIGIPVRCAPYNLQAIDRTMKCVGRAKPARHVGAIDPFLIAMERCEPGDVLVVDDGGRTDRAAVGDLMAREAQNAGMSGIVIWGLNRDTAEQLEIGLPIFSLGRMSTGPLGVDPHSPDANEWCRVGDVIVTEKDIVIADFDGVIFVPEESLPALIPAAEGIREKEKEQTDAMKAGISIRRQISFDGFLEARKQDPGITLRAYLVGQIGLADSSEFVLRVEK